MSEDFQDHDQEAHHLEALKFTTTYFALNMRKSETAIPFEDGKQAKSFKH